MSATRVPLYARLPEIYKIRDEEQTPPGQLQAYLALVEQVFGYVHENVESLYHDLFIEFCDDWVVPYIGDLLGTTALKGDPWTLRADVADTIPLRRRKGTLGAIERLAFDLTRWGAHCVELRENLSWHQHLNHQRPDAGGAPPYSLPSINLNTVVRGGYATLRSPAMLSLLGTPFDSYAHYPDLKPPAFGNIRYNLPNLGIFLWRLAAYSLRTTLPIVRGGVAIAGAAADEAKNVSGFTLDPLSRPVRLFNTPRYDPDRQPPVVTLVDEAPGPMPPARLTTGSAVGNPDPYVSFSTYNPADLTTVLFTDVGLQFHLPQVTFPNDIWKVRGANLCAWEGGLRPPLKNREVAVDPVIGRVLFGVNSAAEAVALDDFLSVTYTEGAIGPIGAHPVSRPAPPTTWKDEVVNKVTVDLRTNPNGLRDALNNLPARNQPLLIEIEDSLTHDLDIAAVAGVVTELDGVTSRPNLALNRTLIIRAASGCRPVIRLANPLRFRPANVVGASPAQQDTLDAVMRNLTVRLEGLFITGTSAVGEPLIARAALSSLEILDCTLDPGGFQNYDGTRAAPASPAIRLSASYGFTTDPAEEAAFEKLVFNRAPAVIVQRTISGVILMDPRYTLSLSDSIIDACKGVGADSSASFALSAAADPVNGWGPPADIRNITVFGRVRVESINARGGIWVHRLEVLNNQKGCIKFSYFSGEKDRLPLNFACVSAPDARLEFTSEIFGQPAYGQLDSATDFRIRERGPNDEAMGAGNFLFEAHKWHNLQVRFREFMPVGVRPLLIPVT